MEYFGSRLLFVPNLVVVDHHDGEFGVRVSVGVGVSVGIGGGLRGHGGGGGGHFHDDDWPKLLYYAALWSCSAMRRFNGAEEGGVGERRN